MNNVVLVGNVVRDIELKTIGSKDTAYVRFTVACQRRYADSDGNRTADFISCTAWGKTAEFIAKYFSKGSKIGINGEIRTGSYEKDGVKVYTTDVNVNSVEFVGNKNTSAPKANTDEFMTIPDGVDEELPFN